MGRMVIACYRPKQGQEAELMALMKTHVETLRREGLATERTPVLMEAADGTIVEVFEWVSAEAIASAHENEAVQAMWAAYAKVCEYVSLNSLAEAEGLFAEFSPLDT